MNNLLRPALCFLLLFSLAACQTAKQETNKEKAHYYLHLGIAELVRADFRGSLRNLLEARRLSPRDPVILNNLGLAYLGLNEFDQAEQALLDSLKIQANYTDARNNLGAVYITKGNYKEAIRHLETAAKDLTYERPDKVFVNLGIAYFRANQFAKSEAASLRALQFSPNHCEATYYYGRSLYSRKSFKLAAETFDRAVQRCKTFDEPYFYAALAYVDLKQRSLASARLRELLEKFPKSAFAERAQQLLEITQ